MRAQWKMNEVARLERLLSTVRHSETVNESTGVMRKKHKAMRQARKRVRQDKVISMAKWRSEARLQYGRYSRAQLMSTLVPEAGRPRSGKVAVSKKMSKDPICSAH